ncbi:TlyA family rRNA (cytidine-2'-O)-methyltransferase [Candidatus Saccharibacteria bacterium]|nr:TlyA family rRNA (cytidine-2'-O)-methyltransferase [Candidatus Saccharibacteria bacterium]
MNTESVKNRGYYKIEGATGAFNFVFKDKVVLDIGSSTGGFTQYALDQGAKKVIAVEKGTGQMKSPLRTDPRVELHEKTDIFDFICTPDIILADVSFISLTKILSYAKDNLANKNTEFLVMLKPQFEAEPRDLTDGVVKNETVRRNLIKKFEQWLKFNGFVIVNKHDNEQKGKHGNRERFYHLRLAK